MAPDLGDSQSTDIRNQEPSIKYPYGLLAGEKPEYLFTEVTRRAARNLLQKRPKDPNEQLENDPVVEQLFTLVEKGHSIQAEYFLQRMGLIQVEPVEN